MGEREKERAMHFRGNTRMLVVGHLVSNTPKMTILFARSIHSIVGREQLSNGATVARLTVSVCATVVRHNYWPHFIQQYCRWAPRCRIG